MSAVSGLVQRIFSKIFKKVAEELGESVNNIQLGICYQSGGAKFKYEAYKSFEKEKDLDLEDYLNIIERGLTATIDSTIGEAGKRLATECECEVNDVLIIMKHREEELPLAVLMAKGKKVRLIEIENEFLT